MTIIHNNNKIIMFPKWGTLIKVYRNEQIVTFCLESVKGAFKLNLLEKIKE